MSSTQVDWKDVSDNIINRENYIKDPRPTKRFATVIESGISVDITEFDMFNGGSYIDRLFKNIFGPKKNLY